MNKINLYKNSPVFIVSFLLLTNFNLNAQQIENNQNVEKVLVQAERNEYSGMRDVVAGKIILGREWLERSAANSAAEALRRESSVSVSSNGKISLKGLQGYTQILLDGQQPLGSEDPLQMDPSLIERIEIIHSASADSGAFGLAGTINVVTRNRRKALPKQFSINGGASDLNNIGNISLQGGWKEPSGTTFNITGNISSSNTTQPRDTLWDWIDNNGLANKSLESIKDISVFKDITVSPSLTWKPTPSDELQIKASLSSSMIRFDNISNLIDGTLYVEGGIRPNNSKMTDINKTNSVSTDSQWRHKLANEGNFSSRVNLTQERIQQKRNANTIWSSNILNQLGSDENSIKNYVNAQFQLSYPNRSGHKVQLALSSNLFTQSKDQSTFINGVIATGAWLGKVQTKMMALDNAVWIQDDWNISDTLDLKLGLRQEHRITKWETVGINSKIAANLTAPSMNLAWKLDPDGERTISLGLARSFSRIGAAMLSPIPDITGTSLCSTNEKCGGNDPNQPDRVGNPKLKYEQSWGLDLALENQFGEESMWSIRAYHRWINDTFSWMTQRESVPWATVPRWVYKPTNIGDATAFGLTLGFDTQISDWIENSPKLGFNASVQWNKSRLSSIPGPDNRLENQQPWSGRFALTYKLNDYPLEIQTDLLLNPAHWWQASIDRRIFTGTHKEISAKGIWTFSPERKLILSVQNLIPFYDNTLTQFLGNSALRMTTSQRPRTMISLRYESSFE